jgi:hypothetical protein
MLQLVTMTSLAARVGLVVKWPAVTALTGQLLRAVRASHTKPE